MPIRHAASLPANGRTVIENHLASPSVVGTRLAATATPAPLQVSEGYPVYTVDLDTLAQGRLLDQAGQVGFRYMIVDNTGAVAEADLVDDPTTGARVRAIHSATHAEGTARGIAAAEQLKAVATDDYELGVIESPGVYFIALWLRRKGADLLIPTAPDMSSLTHGQAYDEAQVTAVLTARAQEVKAMQARFPGPSGG